MAPVMTASINDVPVPVAVYNPDHRGFHQQHHASDSCSYVDLFIYCLCNYRTISYGQATFVILDATHALGDTILHSRHNPTSAQREHPDRCMASFQCPWHHFVVHVATVVPKISTHAATSKSY
eukprot:3933767-Amphidinium_carterae.1